MPTIHYVGPSGEATEVEVCSGTSVMQAAVDNAINGIVGECGASMACATCHCYVDDAWLDRTGSAGAAERDILSGSPLPVTANSRLGCQIEMNDELDGLVVHVPESQY